MANVLSLPIMSQLRQDDARVSKDLSYGYGKALDLVIDHVGIDISTCKNESRVRLLRELRVATNLALDAALELYSFDEDHWAEANHA